MQVNPDFSDLFSELNAANARYLLVGGYAFSYHAEPRTTKDLDVWVEPTGDNAQAVWQALTEFGAPAHEGLAEDLAKADMVVQIGVAPNRIDIVTSIDGVSFDEAWTGRVEATYGEVPIHIIGLRELIKNKRAVGSPQDLEDVDRLTRS
jgi:hypothetical protein